MTVKPIITTALAAWLSSHMVAGAAEELPALPVPPQDAPGGAAFANENIVHDDGTGAQISFFLPTHDKLESLEIEYTSFNIIVVKDGKFLLLEDLSGSKTEDGKAFCGKIIIPSDLIDSAEIGMRGSPRSASVGIQKRLKVSTFKRIRREKSWTDQKSATEGSATRLDTEDRIENSTPVSDAETTEMARFVTSARAAFAKASGGKSLSPEQLAVPDALGKDWKLYSSQEYGGAESGIHELLYTAQKPMLVLSRRDEIVLNIKVFSTVPAAREWALQTALAGAAPMADLVNRAKSHFGKAGLPGDFCFGPDLFVRGNVVVEYGNDVTPVVSDHVDASLLKLTPTSINTPVIKRGEPKPNSDGKPAP